MNSNEYSGLQRLKIPINRWGSKNGKDVFRIKVRNALGRFVFIGNVSNIKNQKLIAKTYKKSLESVKNALAYEYKAPGTYTEYYGKALESHEFAGFSQDEVYEKIQKKLESFTHAYKVNIQLGYKLIDRTNGLEREYYPGANTTVWDVPIAVNSKSDVVKKIMTQMHAKDFTERISFPASAYQLKEINSAKLVIYYRNHILGDSKIEIPDCIKNNRFIINFPKTNNKCVFYCIAYHLCEGDKPLLRRVVSHAKQRVKQYCEFENIPYSAKVFKEFKAVDLMQFDKLEDCFNLSINVFEMDQDTLEISKIRSSEKSNDNVMNILDYKGHAMYITNLDTVLNKYPCSKCGAVFETCEKLHNHKKAKCQFEVIESFSKEPRRYEPPKNRLKTLLSRYQVDDIDHYMDHFIVYDFEAILFNIDEQRGETTRYTSRHQAVSVSVCDSLTKKAQCFVSDTQKGLLEEMFAYIDSIAEKIKQYNLSKFNELFDAISKAESELDAEMKNEGITIENIEKKMKDDPKVARFMKAKSRIDRDCDMLDNLCSQAHVFGFNSGRYDINLIKRDLFAVLGADKVEMVIKNPSYMCIATNTLKILDISNYLPAGTSYDKYLKTYLGGCKCEDKVKCLCGLGKGIFCYEYITSFDKLYETALPPKSAFDSKLKNTKISDEDYERLKFIWDHYKMKSIKDLLIWYNNLDVEPFILAIEKQREFYKRFDLDMFQDGVSLPGLAEKVMYQTCYQELDKPEEIEVAINIRTLKRVEDSIERLMHKIDPAGQRYWSIVSNDETYTWAYINVFDKHDNRAIFAFSHAGDARYIIKKLSSKRLRFELDQSKVEPPFSFPMKYLDGYNHQDKKSGHDFGLTIDHLNKQLIESAFLCTHCSCQLTEKNVSADRIDNKKGHINGNIMISCRSCNVARKDMNIKAFRYQKLLERNSEKLVWSIDEEQKDIYSKMKANIAGGPSIIFNRFAKRDETYIRGGDKLCKKVIGYDANALYLWALGNEMPCGRLTTIEPYDGIIEDIKSDKLFGFLECDIETPEHLKDHFSEMTPIFKNAEIDTSREDVIGSHMTKYANDIGRKPSKSRKLIGSYFGKQVLIYAPLLKWYLEHGLVVSRTYSFIKASSHRPFKSFMDQVSDARREGDRDESQAMVAEMMKLIGNSAFGRSGMDKSKHKEVKYMDTAKSVKAIVEKQNFHDVEELNDSYEVSLNKRIIKLNNPIHLSIAIYQLAKLRMLQFYYDCIDFYFDRSDFQYQEMDTDSGYIAFSADKPFETLIKPELVEHYQKHKYEWFPRDFNDEVAKYDRRTAGLFKEEWRGDAMVSLSSKNYHCYEPEGNNKVKTSAKGVQQGGGRNADILNQDGFESVIKKQICLTGTNRGFRIDKIMGGMITYEQHKTALNYWYDKRIVLADGISTAPIPI